MKNVLLVAYDFPPRGGAAVQRSAKFAKYLPEFGYQPLVLTSSDEMIQGRRDPSMLEEVRDVKVFRCPGHERLLVRLPRKLKLAPLLAFWLRPDAGVAAWLPPAERMALQLAERHPLDAIYVSVAPFSSALLGLRLSKALGVPWVVDYRDPWTTALRLWPTRFHYRLEERQERRALEAADAVVVVTPTMKDLLLERYPQWAAKIHVIYNGFDPQDLAGRTGRPDPRRLRIGFTGTLANYDPSRLSARLQAGAKRLLYGKIATDWSTHTPMYLLQAVRALLDRRPELEDAVRLTFAGAFGDRNLGFVRRLGLQHVVSVRGYVPHAESVQLLLDSDVLFLPMASHLHGQRSYNLSGKVFEYLATRKPILAAVPEGDARDLIQRARAGWCVEPRDVAGMESLLEELIEKKRAGTLGVEPDEAYVGQFERRELTRQLAALLDSLRGEHTRTPGPKAEQTLGEGRRQDGRRPRQAQARAQARRGPEQ